MDGNLVKLWKYIIMGIVAIVASFVGSCQATNYQIRMMVEAGENPYTASCAIDASYACQSVAVIEIEKLRDK